jgi:hypothetical protein
MKILVAQRASVDVNLLGVLKPQSSRAVGTSEAADGIHVPTILHPQRRRRQRPEVRTLDSANRASAQDAHEVSADVAAMLQIETVRHDGPPLAHHGTAIMPDSSLAERSQRGLQNPDGYHHGTQRAACHERLLMRPTTPAIGALVVLLTVPWWSTW